MRITRIAVVAAVTALLVVSCASPQGPNLVSGPTEGGTGDVVGAQAATPLVVTDDGDGLSRPTLSIDEDQEVAVGEATQAITAAVPLPDTQQTPLSLVPMASAAALGAGALGGGGDNSSAEATASRIAVNPESGAPSGTPLVIFDTDLGPDIDDALALAMLHSYQKRGAIELAAVTISRNSTVGARYADAVNTFYGRPDIPIGIDNDDGAPYFDDATNYVALASQWPNDLQDGQINEAYRLQRQVMARGLSEGRPVIIIQVGFSNNLSQLVDSGGDDISPLSGVELARQSVSVLSVMAGSIARDRVEFNVEKDIPSARNLFAKWPGRIILSPFELGYSVLYPYSAIQNDLNWTDRHIVRQSYEFRNLDWHQAAGAYYDMRSWDLTSVIEAIEPSSGYFFVSQPGLVTVDESGRTYFNQGGGQHYVLDRSDQYSGDQRNRIINRMIELVSDRP